MSNNRWFEQHRESGKFRRRNLCKECGSAIEQRRLKKKILFYKNKQQSSKYVYFIKCENYMKIGESHNPFHRLNSMKTGNPFDLKLIFYFYSEKIKECDLQFFCYNYDKHHRNEWFIYDQFIERLIEFLKIYLKSLQRIILFEEGKFSYNLRYYIEQIKQYRKDLRFIKNFEKFILKYYTK